jgi:hypothetical protein
VMKSRRFILISPDSCNRAAGKCLPSRLGDLQANDLDRASADDHAFDRRDHEPGDAQINYQLDGKPVRQHNRLGAAVARRGEQLKGAAAVGLEAVVTTAGLGHGVSG